MLIVGSVEATKLSFLLFHHLTGLVFYRAVAAVFHNFYSLESNLTIDPNTNVAKVEKRSCSKIKIAQKFKVPRLLRSICGPSLFMKRGTFLIAFFFTYIFRSEGTL